MTVHHIEKKQDQNIVQPLLVLQATFPLSIVDLVEGAGTSSLEVGLLEFILQDLVD